MKKNSIFQKVLLKGLWQQKNFVAFVRWKKDIVLKQELKCHFFKIGNAVICSFRVYYCQICQLVHCRYLRCKSIFRGKNVTITDIREKFYIFSEAVLYIKNIPSIQLPTSRTPFQKILNETKLHLQKTLLCYSLKIICILIGKFLLEI